MGQVCAAPSTRVLVHLECATPRSAAAQPSPRRKLEVSRVSSLDSILWEALGLPIVNPLIGAASAALLVMAI